MFHVGQKAAPDHAEEADENHLIAGPNKGKVDCLHDWPVDHSHLPGVPEFVAYLKTIQIKLIFYSFKALKNHLFFSSVH